ncbi:MAG: HNH endonuclease signature motif containing protein [Methylococcales bacterium]|nr:HNH endonuclease signature motif containing protein [Methylococcales bacterium]
MKNSVSFSEETVQIVWNKGLAVFGYNAAIWRQDQFGFWMNRVEYGNRNSDYGWEIDHIIPVAIGGSDKLSNLRPLYWKNNMARTTT